MPLWCAAGFMILWCSFLPFALWEICGWATPFVEAAIAFLLLGIENVGAHFVVHRSRSDARAAERLCW